MKSRTFYPLLPGVALVASLPLSAGAEGFLDDTKANLTLRNFYMNRDYTGDASQNKAAEWTQSFILDLKSGFTPGTVGFGVDVLGLYSIKARWRQRYRRHATAAGAR
jgi:outer membrane porin, OprD family.